MAIASNHVKEWIRPTTYPVAGIDEVGRGPLAGPVVAAAVILPLDFDATGIHDSKVLSAAAREVVSKRIRDESIWSLGWVSEEEIDALNILKATDEAMRRAILGLPVSPSEVWVDGNRVPPGLGAPAQALIKGDGLHLSIAAASILAKVERDAYMVRLDQKFPDYGFVTNMGYGTAEHMAALKRIGPCACHRMSFAPVAAASQLCLTFEN